MAGEGNCIRYLGTIDTVAAQRPYNFADINTGVAATNGISGTLHIRSIMVARADGQQWMRPRPWPWFQLMKMNNPVPAPGMPNVWAQYAQGTAGTFWLDPIPDDDYTLTCDCVCLPIDLANDATVEAIPPLWQTAVRFLAAYFALLSAQNAQRQADADRMMERYSEFVDRARKFATPEVNPALYAQSKSPTMINQLGLTPKAGAQ